MVTNVSLNTFMVTWDNVCDSISSVDKLSVNGYIISSYNSTRGILGEVFISSSCKDSETEFHTASFSSNSSVQFVSVSAENICGRGEATNDVVDGMYAISCLLILPIHL